VAEAPREPEVADGQSGRGRLGNSSAVVNMTFGVASLTMWRTSSHLKLELIETTIAPTRSAARYARANAGTFGRKSATRSP
jgi:hypothetical protein